MPLRNIDEHEWVKSSRGNGGQQSVAHRKSAVKGKPTKAMIMGCWKHPNTCEGCNVLVELCNGNLEKL